MKSIKSSEAKQTMETNTYKKLAYDNMSKTGQHESSNTFINDIYPKLRTTKADPCNKLNILCASCDIEYLEVV